MWQKYYGQTVVNVPIDIMMTCKYPHNTHTHTHTNQKYERVRSQEERVRPFFLISGSLKVLSDN